MNDLDGKWILITGGAVRIGRVLALGLAREGANIILHYGLSKISAEKTAKEVQELGSNVLLIQADLANPEDVHQLMEKAFNWSSVYALINNASVFDPLTWEDTSLLEWDRTLRINLTAPFLLSQSFAKYLPKQQHGRIINLLDWRAFRPGTDHFPYTISKSALAALTASLAQAFAPNISVNGLALGAILPPTDGQDLVDILSRVPSQRWGDLEEVVRSALFLLSGPSYITGEILHLDGGRHLV